MLDIVSVELNLVARAFPLKMGRTVKKNKTYAVVPIVMFPQKVLLVLVLKSFYST